MKKAMTGIWYRSFDHFLFAFDCQSMYTFIKGIILHLPPARYLYPVRAQRTVHHRKEPYYGTESRRHDHHGKR